jgi:hypothetical protein
MTLLILWPPLSAKATQLLFWRAEVQESPPIQQNYSTSMAQCQYKKE